MQLRTDAIEALSALCAPHAVSAAELQAAVDRLQTTMSDSINAKARRLLEEAVHADPPNDLDDTTRAAIDTRQHAFEEFMQHSDTAHWQDYTDARRTANSLLKKRKHDIWSEKNHELVELSKTDPRKFWARTKSYLRPRRNRLPTPDADAFHAHFRELFQSDAAPPALPTTPLPETAARLPALLAFLRDEQPVFEAVAARSVDDKLQYVRHAASGLVFPASLFDLDAFLRDLPNWKAAGRDRLCYEFFKYTAAASAPLLSMLFAICWTLPAVPGSWREGVVCPLYKQRGDPLDPDNYRSVTLGSCMEKMFCHALLRHLTPHIDPNLADEQFGFRPHRGTEPAVLLVNEMLQRHCHTGCPLYMVFVDLTKAFDHVQWPILFH